MCVSGLRPFASLRIVNKVGSLPPLSHGQRGMKKKFIIHLINQILRCILSYIIYFTLSFLLTLIYFSVLIYFWSSAPHFNKVSQRESERERERERGERERERERERRERERERERDRERRRRRRRERERERERGEREDIFKGTFYTRGKLWNVGYNCRWCQRFLFSSFWHLSICSLWQRTFLKFECPVLDE